MSIKLYPQWQNYWFAPEFDFGGPYTTPYIFDSREVDTFYNRSTVLNDFYLSRSNAQSGKPNQYSTLSQWAYDGDVPTNGDQNCTLQNLNTQLENRASNGVSTIETLEQEDFQIIFDDETAVLDFEDLNINARFIRQDPEDPDVTLGKSIIFSTLCGTIFGKYSLDEYNDGDQGGTGYEDNTGWGGAFDPQNPYRINKRVARIFIEAYLRRYKILRERFPNADLGCYSLAAGWDVLNYDNNGEYEATRRGLANFLLYINRAGPYGDTNDINYIRTDDPGPELGLELMELMDSVSFRLVLGSQIAQIPDPLDNFGDTTQGINRGVGTFTPNTEEWSIDEARLVMWEQVSTALRLANTSVNYVNTENATGEVIKSGTIKLEDYLNIAYHLPYRFGNAGYDDRGFVPTELFDMTLELINFGNENRETKIENVFYWAGAYAGTNIFAFVKEGGVFDFVDEGIEEPPTYDPANPYTPRGRLFDLDLFNTSGCELPLPLPPEQLQVLEDIITGEAFRSPVEGAVNNILGGVGDIIEVFANATDTLLIREDGNPLATFIDQDGNVQIHTAVSYMTERLNRATEISEEFQAHAYRLSGVSNYLNGYNEYGGIGEYPGLSGIQAIAQNFNNIKNTIESGNLGDALIDHYSPFFGSILGPGEAMYESFNSLINGDIRAFLNTFPITDNRLNLGGGTIQQLEELIGLGNSILDFELSIRNLIDSDNNYYFAALDYLAKSSLGFSVLTMLEDPCFSQKLLGQIAKPDLKGLLNIP